MKITLGVLAALAVAAGLLLLWPPAREALQVADEGGEKLLRDGMRPIRGTTRVLILALDGVGDASLRRALATGRAPHLAALLGAPEGPDRWAHGVAVPDVLTVAPSMTMAAWTAMFTGEPPGRTGIPGNEWYDRAERRFWSPGLVSVSAPDDITKVYADGLLGDLVPVPTLWEGLPLRVHLSLVLLHRGADLLNVPAPADVAEVFVRSAQGVADDDAETDRAPYGALDRAVVDQLLESLDEHGVPDVQVAYFPGIDLYVHVADRPLEAQLDYLHRVLDPEIGRVLDRYRAEGVLDRTWVLVVADHGHTPVLSDDVHSLGAHEENDPHEVVRHAGYRVRPKGLYVAGDDHQVVTAWQGPLAFVQVADRTTCPEAGDVCDWARPPRLEDDVLPLVRAFEAAGRTGEGAPGMRGALDLILVREGRPLDQDALPFDVWADGARVPLDAWLAAHPRPDLPRAAERLHALATGPLGHRAGEILLIARYGEHLPIEERFYFSPKYRSSHGGLGWQDSHVPLLVAHPGLPADAVAARVGEVVGPEPSILDVAPLVRHLLDVPAASAPEP